MFHACLLLLAMALPAGAASFSWTNTTAGAYNWNDNANWTPAGYPNATGDLANLSLGLNGDHLVDLNQPSITVGSLSIGTTAGGSKFTVVNSAAGPLIFDNGASNATLTQVTTSAGDVLVTAVQVNGPLTVNNTVNNTLKPLTFGAALYSGASSGTQTVTVLTPANGGVVVNGIVGNGSSGGIIALLKTGAGSGTLVLSNANTFGGGVVVNGGAVTGYGQAGGSPFGATGNSISIGSGDGAGVGTAAAALNLIGQAGATTAAIGDLTAAGAFNGGTLTVNATAGGQTALLCANLIRRGAGTLVVTPGTGSLGNRERITVSGSGNSLSNGLLPPWLVLSQNNGDFATYGIGGMATATYVTAFNSGLATQVVNLTVATNLAAGQQVYALKASASVNLNGHALTVGDGAMAGMIFNNAGIFNNGSAANLALGGAEAVVYVDAGKSGTIGVPIAGSAGITKFGGGTLVISNNNICGGNIALQSGTLTLKPAADTIYGGNIAGAGNVIKDGRYALTLTGTNTATLAANAITGGGTLILSGGVFTNPTVTTALSWFGSPNNTVIVTNNALFYHHAPVYGQTNCTIVVAGTGTVWNMLAHGVNTENMSLGAANCRLVVADGGTVTNCTGFQTAANNVSLILTNGGQFTCGSGAYYCWNAGNQFLIAGTNASGRPAQWNFGGTLSLGDGNNTAVTLNQVMTIGGGGIYAGAISVGARNGMGNTLVLTNGGRLTGQVTFGGANNSVRVVGADPNTGVRSTIDLGGSTLLFPVSFNTVTVDGGLITNGTLYVSGQYNGSSGGLLVLTNGGQMFTANAGVGWGGNQAGNCIGNRVVVSGPGSLWNGKGGTLYIGNRTGYGGASAIGNAVHIEAGGVLTNAGPLYVGYGSTASPAIGNVLTVTNGGRAFSTGQGVVGSAGVSNMAVVAGGPFGDSVWSLGAQSLTVGSGAATGNALRVESGGAIANVGALTIGSAATSYGNRVTLNGGALSASSLTMTAGVNNAVVFNSGVLRLQTATVGNGIAFNVGDGGAGDAELNLTGGTNKLLTFASGLAVTSNGMLTGSGRLAATTTVSGVLWPGTVGSATAMTFTASLTLTRSARLRIAIGGMGPGTQYGFVNASGQTVDLGSARLEVSLLGSYVPGRSDVFTNLVAGTLNVNFGNLELGRILLTNRQGSFAVDTSGNKVVLSDYLVNIEEGSVLLIQ